MKQRTISIGLFLFRIILSVGIFEVRLETLADNVSSARRSAGFLH